MCKYFKKQHPCGHLSRVQIDRCLDACTTAITCKVPTPSDEDLHQHARKSYIACYDCILTQAYAERDAAAQRAQATEKDPSKLEEIAGKRAWLANKQAKLEGKTKVETRREAAAQVMRAERERDKKKDDAKRAEREWAQRGEGLWIAAGSARKKGRRHHGQAPRSAPPIPEFGDAGGVGRMGDFKKDGPKCAGEGGGGRAGSLGRKSAFVPKKILTRGENQNEEWGCK